MRSIAALAGLALAACSAPVSDDREPPASFSSKPDLFWVTVDALRPDHLGAYGHARETSPAIDAYFESGARFERAFAQGTWTLFVTSRFPQSHLEYYRERAPQAFVGPDTTTMAERLSAEGYLTIHVSGHGALGAFDGLCRGFEVCDVEYRDARDVTARAREAVEEATRTQPGRPLFLWAYYIDPHVPYEAPAKHANRFVGDGHERSELRAGVAEGEYIGHRAIPRAALGGGGARA